MPQNEYCLNSLDFRNIRSYASAFYSNDRLETIPVVDLKEIRIMYELAVSQDLC
jgi:hypothetical protein